MVDECINEFKKLGYWDYCPVYTTNHEILNIEFYNDREKILIDSNGAIKEVKDNDEDCESYSSAVISYHEMKAVCNFMENHGMIAQI